jgi:uncharacterized protein
MVKTAFLLHGTGGNDKDYFWFGDIKAYLERQGYSTWWPQLPNTDSPDFEETLNFIEQNIPLFGEQTIVIGHSSSCPLILSWLQHIRTPIKQVILVAGYYEPMEGDATSLLQKEEFNWAAIKSAAKEIIIINSDNDPWGCDDKQARPTAEKLGAKFILSKGEGHMGSGTYNQPYKEFPLLKELITL